MKTITIQQPFASLIINGYKKYEFRTWKTNYRGKVLIHAGLGVNTKAKKRFENLNLEYPKGEIIGIATITDCIKVDDKFREILKKENSMIYQSVISDKDWEGYAFKLENVEKIPNIPAKGKLSFWDYDYKE